MFTRSFSPGLLSLILFTACSSSALTTKEEKVSAPNPSFSGRTAAFNLEESSITFLGKSNIINHKGSFPKFIATLTLNSDLPADLEKAELEAVIDIRSIQTDTERLTGHLMKEDFFAVDTYPEATFHSTVIRSLGDSVFAITGNLTIKGVTQSVTFDAMITDDALTFQYDLPRKVFGIGNDSYGDKLLDPLVPVEAKLIFVE